MVFRAFRAPPVHIPARPTLMPKPHPIVDQSTLITDGGDDFYQTLRQQPISFAPHGAS
jgi:hypothetical protein